MILSPSRSFACHGVPKLELGNQKLHVTAQKEAPETRPIFIIIASIYPWANNDCAVGRRDL